MYGQDVSKDEFDSLDKSSFHFLRSFNNRVNCIDIGCRSAHTALVYSLMGHDCYMIDLKDQEEIPILKQ